MATPVDRAIDKDTAHVNEKAEYFLPENDTETARLNYQHWFIKEVWWDGRDQLWAPVERELDNSGARMQVLDAGCGTGIWSVEANDRLKGRADFTLADMSLNTCRASYKTLPDNFELVELNLRSDYPREHGWHDKFDLVQQRLLFFALGAEEWPQILKKHFEVIKPGGYIQLLEFSPGRDFRNVFEPVFSWAGGLAVDLATKKGMDVFIAERLKDLCKEAGFEIVTEEWKRLKMPDGPVPGEPVHNVGKQWYINTCASTSSLPLKLGAIPKDEWDARQPELEKEAEEAGRRGFYMDSVVVVGRKPQ